MLLLLLLTIIAALFLLGAWYAYRVTFYSPKSKRAKLDDPLLGDQYDAVAENITRISHIMEKAPFESITLKAHDGTALFGRYYHVRDGAPLEILFHGYRSHPFRDCSGGHALSRKMGFNALVVDQRAHGASGSCTITFGIKERFDVKTWTEYVTARFGTDTPILLSGLSMGAATVLMASDLQLPGNVTAIIADSPYSAPSEIIEKVCTDLHYPVRLVRPFLYLGAWLFGGFRLGGTNALDAVSKTDIPILLLHGEADRLVPCSMSLEIARRCAGPASVLTFPEAGHGLCYMVDPRRYEQAVYGFLCTVPKLKASVSQSFIDQLYDN